MTLNLSIFSLRSLSSSSMLSMSVANCSASKMASLRDDRSWAAERVGGVTPGVVMRRWCGDEALRRVCSSLDAGLGLGVLILRTALTFRLLLKG
jgi:hypothetical protein